MSKKALGRGIGALFKDMDTAQDLDESRTVPIRSLKPNPYQPRARFSDESLKELAQSIGEKGVIQPLLVEADEDGTYTIIAGERRMRAARMAGLREVPVIVRRFSMVEKIEIALIENIQREDLSPVEEAQGYKTLMDLVQLSQEEIARRVGKNRSTVTNSLRLLKLPEPMLLAVDEGEISAGHARALLAVINPADQQVLFDRIKQRGLTVREAEAMAQELNQGKRSEPRKQKPENRPRPDAEMEALRQKLIDALGTKVDIKGSLAKGRIEIAYFSGDDLERVMELLGVQI